jgi:PAS domain S-box-containing protein
MTPVSFPDAGLIVNARCLIILANAAAASLFGFEEHDLTGMSVEELFPGQPLIFLGGRAGHGGQTGHYLELVGHRRDASQFPAAVSVMHVQVGKVPVAMLSIRDLAQAQRDQYVLSRGLKILMSDDRHRQALLRRLVLAREEERARIAADIHIDAVQLLSAANLRLQQLGLRLDDPAGQQVLDVLQDTLSPYLSHLRHVIYDLSPPGLTDGSLGAALRVYLEQMHADTGIAYRLDDRISARAPDSTARLIYTTVLGAMANVRQHARAGTVLVELLDFEDGCLGAIVDDGVGYDPADVEGRPGHLGLALIRERAELAGGWCRIESSPGAGTTVEFWVPFAGPTSAD